MNQRGDLSGTIAAAFAIGHWTIRHLSPMRVVDVGCGDGAFTRWFLDAGVDAVGLDKAQGLFLPAFAFCQVDLESDYQLCGTYDVGLCLEVAEHLHAGRPALQLIRNLCSACRYVIWSAAIPHQGGWHHINEQWPSYWAEMFSMHGFVPSNALRNVLWNRADLPPWYRQNVLVYATAESLRAAKLTEARVLDLVHPAMWSKLTLSGIWSRVC